MHYIRTLSNNTIVYNNIIPNFTKSILHRKAIICVYTSYTVILSISYYNNDNYVTSLYTYVVMCHGLLCIYNYE